MSTSNTLFQRRNDSYIVFEIFCKRYRFVKDIALDTMIFKNLFASKPDKIIVYGYCFNSIEIYIKYRNTKTEVDFTKHVKTNWYS
ncbi:putative Ig-like V-type domain-containing protein FPV055 [BeAn 58058 virus]|uniref:putative Ig-like V-type domain-containing protein FPV055 n=1 Tax=BeAn 58058 virus TaxID=67082 RepID=UPI00090A0C62|nr:putative Ig-like V-type domain-containing protein FPV055 [BeAn 58058 virus]APG58193.1 putative Ig-like V-type domain-containing protein FPV055 [BeAn 58058 virus]